eukprot:scaffold29424_cov54-Cyclotella_meneghiniana.AAC.3
MTCPAVPPQHRRQPTSDHWSFIAPLGIHPNDTRRRAISSGGSATAAAPIFPSDSLHFCADEAPVANNYADELETDANTSSADNESNFDTSIIKESLNKSNLRRSKPEEIRVSVSDIDAYRNCEQECANNNVDSNGLISNGCYFGCLERCPSQFADNYNDDFSYDDDYYYSDYHDDVGPYHADELETETVAKTSFAHSNLHVSRLQEIRALSVSDIDDYQNCEQECLDNYYANIISSDGYFDCVALCPSPYIDDYYDDLSYDDYYYDDHYYDDYYYDDHYYDDYYYDENSP